MFPKLKAHGSSLHMSPLQGPGRSLCYVSTYKICKINVSSFVFLNYVSFHSTHLHCVMGTCFIFGKGLAGISLICCPWQLPGGPATMPLWGLQCFPEFSRVSPGREIVASEYAYDPVCWCTFHLPFARTSPRVPGPSGKGMWESECQVSATCKMRTALLQFRENQKMG